ncbi:MAG TPA: ATP-binding protein [Rhodoferax sp.]|nr:ATP-binding protein [Rhodoferax sp.]
MRFNPSPAKPEKSGQRSPRVFLTVFFGVLLVALWALIGWGIQRSYANAESTARRELSNLTWAFAETVEASVNTLDIALQDLREDWSREPAKFAERVVFKQRRLAKEVVFEAAIIGANGILQYSSREPQAGPIEMSDRAYFQIHNNRQQDSLFISDPVLGRISNRWSVLFTRPLLGPGGRFEGVIVLSVASDYFMRHYETFNFQEGSTSSLMDQNGHVLARWPAPDGQADGKLDLDQLMKDMDSSGQGWIEKPSAFDQVHRLHRWRKVTGHDLVVVLGFSTQNMFAAQHLQRNVYLMAGVAGSVFLIWFGLLFINALRRNEQASHALHLSEERWNLALESGEFTVWDLNPRTGQVFRLSRSSEIFGDELQETEASADEWASRLHPQDLPRTLELVQACLSGTQSRYATEYRVQATDGSWRWALDRGMVIGRDEAGQALRMIGTLSDITTRRAEQQQLVDNQRFLRTLMDALPSMVGYWRTDMTCSFANLAHQNYFQRSAQGLQDVPLKALLGEVMFQKQHHYFEAALAGRAQMFELEWPQSDGSKHVFWTQYLPDVESDGQVHGVVSLLTDVSSIKATQTTLERLNRQLLERDDKARQASQATTALQADARQDIRTLMNSVINTTVQVLHSNPEYPARKELDMLEHTAETLLGVIDELESFSDIEAGRLVLEALPFKLVALVEDTVAKLTASAQQKSLTLKMSVSSAIPVTVVGDPVYLGQILAQLLGNAIKFTEHGAVAMEVILVSLNDKTVKLQFDVRDSGIGIELERQKSIFKPFWHKVGQTARGSHNTKGTGLGLSVARALVELMEGRIWLSSRPGQGSTFSFTVKLGVPEPSSPSTGAARISNPDADITDGQTTPQPSLQSAGLDVLLVDDYPRNQTYAAGLLALMGHRVTVANNGQEAVDWVRQKDFDLVLMDLQMPVMNGLEATLRIRLNETASGRPRVRIVAMTAFAVQSEVDQCFSAGMDDFVAKPFTPDDLARQLDLHLNSRQ